MPELCYYVLLAKRRGHTPKILLTDCPAGGTAPSVPLRCGGGSKNPSPMWRGIKGEVKYGAYTSWFSKLFNPSFKGTYITNPDITTNSIIATAKALP